MPEAKPAMTGGCQCGAVRYALYEPPISTVCHCRMCQKAVGGPFAALLKLPLARFAWTRGEPAKFNCTVTPRLALRNDASRALNESVSEAAAKTERLPLSVLGDAPDVAVDPQAVIATASATTAVNDIERASLKGALGDMYRSLSIDGSSTTTAGTIFFPVSGGAGTSLGGGIFAQPSNIGTYGSHQLAGVAELGVRTGYQLTDRLIPYIAYNALYVSSIIRPGDAVSPYINTTATALAAASRASGFASPLGGPLGPTVNAGGTGVWIQDVSAGVALRF